MSSVSGVDFNPNCLYLKDMTFLRTLIFCMLLIGCTGEERSSYANIETRLALNYLEPPIQIKFRGEGIVELTDSFAYTVIVEINEIGEIRVIGQLPFEIRSYINEKKLEAFNETLRNKNSGEGKDLGPR